MDAYLAAELGFKNGYKKAVSDIFDNLKTMTSFDTTHTYYDKMFIIDQFQFAKLMKRFGIQISQDYLATLSKEEIEILDEIEPVDELTNL